MSKFFKVLWYFGRNSFVAFSTLTRKTQTVAATFYGIVTISNYPRMPFRLGLAITTNTISFDTSGIFLYKVKKNILCFATIRLLYELDNKVIGLK